MGERVLEIILLFSSILIISSFAPVQAEYYLDKINYEPLLDEYTRPTFGIDHETNQQLINGGFKINNQTFDITDNFHTPFDLYNIEIGNLTSFETILYAPMGLEVQELLFGIPEAGEAHLAEMRIEIWYGLDGEIKTYKVMQRTNVIDPDQIILNHSKVKCNEDNEKLDCDHTKLSIIFLEPLKDKVIAIKAIDFKKRYQITYLNEGIDLSGNQINPYLVKLIPSPKKHEGLIPVTQIEKYSSLWSSEDGRLFAQNSFGSFNQINIKFERFEDDGEPRTRLHSGFSKVINEEQKRAIEVFDSTKIISELPESFTIYMSKGERITEEIKEIMFKQEQIAKKIIENSDRQIREY